ncbi:MAG: DUF488 domain-containing protein [Acidobacteria bacterium]|nr:DUF488 domain-containing protein [Acidobacteriota bacterium]
MIYTAGYYGRDFQQFKATVKHLDAAVIDIRLMPQSRFFPDWRKRNLELELSPSYFHVVELGNKAFKENRIEILDLAAGMQFVKRIIEEIQRDVILLCACKSLSTCHRHIVAEAFRKEGHKVQELPDA